MRVSQCARKLPSQLPSIVLWLTQICFRALLQQYYISKFGKELQALRITIIATIGPIWTENYDILSFFVNEA